MHNAHSYWLHYFALFGLVVMSLLWIDTILQPKKLVDQKCVVSVYHAGHRVDFIGKGEVWE